MSKLYAALLLSVCVALALLAYQNHSLHGQVQQQSKDNQALADEVDSAKQAVTSQASMYSTSIASDRDTTLNWPPRSSRPLPPSITSSIAAGSR